MKRIFYTSLISILFISNTWCETGNNFPIPPLISGDEINLTMKNGELVLPFGTSKTMGFNGNFLGPTIRVSNGDLVKINIKNDIGEESTVHWHGLHVPAEFDGGPHQIIKADETWKPQFTVKQNAATLWYHPHLMGKTAEHVYKGLAGLFIIDDDYSKKLRLPDEYGINDIPLILQERRLDKNGQFEYRPRMPDIMHGYIGNIMLVNGSYQPELDIDQGTYRFRVLNGSNSSLIQISFSDNRSFTVIASDGGFLPASVQRKSLILSPGERFEILTDFVKKEKLSLLSEISGGNTYDTFSINVSGKKDRIYPHPESFEYRPVEITNSNPKTRTFTMENRGMRGFFINGRQMSIKRIDFNVKKKQPEIWIIESVGRGMMRIPHSFHVHDVQFSIISINGKKPDPIYSGPKDTVLLMPGGQVKIALIFKEYTGVYMYHCHFLEHEDQGMMGQFMVTD